MTKAVEDITKKLNSNLPASAVFKRKGPGGRMLDYISGFTCTDYLNRIFGPLGWSFTIRETIVENAGTATKCRVLGHLYVNMLEEGVCKISDDWGYGKGTGPDAEESAIKEARTDALKRCAKDMGYVLGLALYDKDQKHVGKGE